MASFLDTLFGGGAQEDAANKNAAALAQYQSGANTALGTGYATGSQALNSAVGAYSPLVNLGATYSGAAPTYMGAIGAGTPEAQAAARTSFENTPGLQAMRDAATQAVARQHANAGNPSSGNADIDAILSSAGITSQQYQQFVNNLGNAGQMGISATGAGAAGTAAGYGSLANLATQYGQDQSGVLGNVASGTMADNNMVAAGQAAGAKNLLSAGMSVASMAMGLPPGMSGGGGGSSLTSFGGGSGFGTGLQALGQGYSPYGGGPITYGSPTYGPTPFYTG